MFEISVRSTTCVVEDLELYKDFGFTTNPDDERVLHIDHNIDSCPKITKLYEDVFTAAKIAFSHFSGSDDFKGIIILDDCTIEVYNRYRE